MDPFEVIISMMDSKAKLNNASLAGAMLRYGTQQQLFDNIKQLIDLRQDLENRITSILSDYTQMINQVSIVSTLTLGMALGSFGSLLGNVDDQPEWKIVLFTYSCVLTISFSVLSVIESFFLAIHINQVEARFVGGVYPHITKDKRRSFAIEELEDLNSNLNFIILTFFISFLVFSTTILGTVYIGLGLSNNVFTEDSRLINVEGHKFVNDTRWDSNATNVPLHVFEPTYISAAATLTFIVFTTYSLILYRFFSSYVNKIHGKQLLRFLLLCSCIDPTNSTGLKTPMKAAATRFNNLQRRIAVLTKQWFQSTTECIIILLDFQKDQGTEAMQLELSDKRNKFEKLNPNPNPKRSLTIEEDKTLSQDIREYKKNMKMEYNKKKKKKDKKDKTMGEFVWDELENKKKFYVTAFDISIITLSHGCGVLTDAIRRASQQWNATNKTISKFMVDETTQHVITALEAHIDVLKQHVIAENVAEPPKLSYEVSGQHNRLVLMFLFVYLTFGIVGSIISIAFAVLWMVWYNISTCFSYSPCFCLCCWKGNRDHDQYYCCKMECSNMQHVKDCSMCCIHYIGKLKKYMIDNELAKRLAKKLAKNEPSDEDETTTKTHTNQYYAHKKSNRYAKYYDHYDHINF